MDALVSLSCNSCGETAKVVTLVRTCPYGHVECIEVLTVAGPVAAWAGSHIQPAMRVMAIAW